MSCTFEYIVWLLRPLSTLYGLEKEERAERTDGGVFEEKASWSAIR